MKPRRSLPARELTMEGRQVPSTLVFAQEDGQIRSLDTAALCAGRNIIVIGLPGAFTPTCSSQHLPRYEELAQAFREQAIDDIYCVAVNDPYAMAQWGRDQQISRVRLLADGNGEFTKAMGMLVDHRQTGMGWRSRRYAMLVRDGLIEKLLAEPDEPGDPYTVSDADTMLNYLAPQASRPKRIALLTKPGCPHCAKARKRLDDHHLHYDEIALDDAARMRVIGAFTGATTAPQVFIDGKLIGGFEQLETYLREQA